MRIAIPMARGALCLHFGHCENFALLDVDPEKRTVVGKSVVDAPDHQPGLLPRWLAERDVTTVIAGGMGMRAQKLFADRGIEVLIGAPSGSPEEVVQAWLDGTIELGANPCGH